MSITNEELEAQRAAVDAKRAALEEAKAVNARLASADANVVDYEALVAEEARLDAELNATLSLNSAVAEAKGIDVADLATPPAPEPVVEDSPEVPSFVSTPVDSFEDDDDSADSGAAKE